MTVSLQRSAPGEATPNADSTPDASAPAVKAQRSRTPTPPREVALANEDRRAGRAFAPAQDASAAGRPASEAAAVDADLGADYVRQLEDHVEPFKRYPDDANLAAIRGVVKVSFVVDRQGRLLGVKVSQTSGSVSLDQAAVDTLRRAAPMPPIPPALPDALSVDLPIEFLGAG